MIRGRLWLWCDRTTRAPIDQMALDQALLEAGEPVLRLYGWDGCCATFGYFLRWRELAGRMATAGLAFERVIRRRSGGGLVFHGDDIGFTLACPTPAWCGGERFRGSPALVHGALAEALRAHGWPVAAVAAESGDDLDCFRHPVVDDLELDGRKVVGAGQRRSRQGLLHQGSLQLADVGLGWAGSFAAGLAEEVVVADAAAVGRWERVAVGWRESFADPAWRMRR